MGWTLNSAPPPKGSGRNWRDFVNLKAMNILLWDPYNHKLTDGHIRLDTGEKMFGQCASESAKVGKPWGIAEFGTPIGPGWPCSIEEVADWFRKLAVFARAPGKDPVTGLSRQPAKYVCYWNDEAKGRNYRLEDYRPLQEAWAAEVRKKA